MGGRCSERSSRSFVSGGINSLWSIFGLFFGIVVALIVAPAQASDNPHRLKKEFLKGYNFTQTGKSEKAIPALEKVRQSSADFALRDYALYTLGRSYLSQRRCGEARQVFKELSENHPDSRWFALADIQARSVEDCPQLKVPETVEPTVDCTVFSNPKGEADCWFEARQYPRAKEIYRSLPPTPEVLTRLSQSAARSQDYATAIQANEMIRARFPRSREAREAPRKIAFLHQDAGDFTSALGALKGLEGRARFPSERRLYDEKMGWCHFRLGQYESAVVRYNQALALEETPRSLYWKARTLERLDQREEAERIFRGLTQIYGASYYGIRAAERLGRRTWEDWWNHLPGGISWDRWMTSAEASRELERTYELVSLGLLEDAAVEARRARSRLGLFLPADPKKIRKAEDGRFLFEMQSPKAEDVDYRIPYASHLLGQFKKMATPEIDHLDPWLLFAMMRQESRFRETVVSPAGAVGLLQIMPATGRKLANEAGWEEYRPEWLYDPLTNIDLAIQYLEKLARLFGGRWYAVAASYNAGEQVVVEWLKRRNGLTEEEFIEEIPYQETRDYVMKVYVNWKAYRVIYGAADSGGVPKATAFR